MMVVNFVFVIVKLGGKVGLLDVDIYGFLVLLMFGKIKVKLVVCDNKWMQLIEVYGIVMYLIGYLVDEVDVVIWCGLMVFKVLVQLFNEIEWLDLDYLVIDMLLGMGDI